ncbi:hypothetical protein D3C71_2013460 [compost metagenome]
MGVDAGRHHTKNGVCHFIIQATIGYHVHAVRRPAQRIRRIGAVHEDFDGTHASHAVTHVGGNAG